jgi:PST family polysaccharide transporter
MNLDDLLVARLMGTAALGVYSMSYNMVNSSVLFLTRPLSELLLPTMARLLDDRAAFTRATLSAISAFSAIS